MQYYCASFYTEESHYEMLVALLGDAGFEMFEEEKARLNAYIPSGGLTEVHIRDIISSLPEQFTGTGWTIELCPEKNWNEVWESSFSPVLIDGRILVRAPFHAPSENTSLMDIIIEPKMSFGTGHHPTTELMMTAMLDQDFTGKSVVDMGCGSGILSIMAAKSGAGSVFAVDIDDWAVENALENCQRNSCSAVEIVKGNVSAARGKKADVLLANINRNILLQDMDRYAALLVPGGIIYMSGFLEADQPVMQSAAALHGLMVHKALVRNGWMMMSFQKSV